jgi:hypothetical protein
VLIDLLSPIGAQIAEFWQTVDMDALDGRVTWAGPGPVPLWLDAARDYSEYWTHHQQICDATGRTGLADPEYAGPAIDTFMRALPHTLRDAAAPEHTTLQVIVTGPGGGHWTCTRAPDRWTLHRRTRPRPDARLELDTDTTWRLCTRGITPEQAARRADISGDRRLAAAALDIVSIIWESPDARRPGQAES